MKIFEFLKKKLAQSICDTKSYVDDLHDKTIRDCRTLYPNDGYGNSWCCGSGWYPIISRLSYKLEAFNVLYAKYGIIVVADQIKEKFGTLRFYTSTFVEPPLVYNFISKLLVGVQSFNKKHFKFNLVSVVDRNEHVGMFVHRLTKDEYHTLNGVSGPTEMFHKSKMLDGKKRYYKISKLNVCAETHQKPTKNRIIYHFNKIIDKITPWFDFSHFYVNSRKLVVLSRYVNNEVERLVREAEGECGNVCEKCGRPFDENLNPRCETVGYIQYVCEKCATSSNATYYKNKKLFGVTDTH